MWEVLGPEAGKLCRPNWCADLLSGCIRVLYLLYSSTGDGEHPSGVYLSGDA